MSRTGVGSLRARIGNRRSPPTVAVALAVVLAGCTGGAAGPDTRPSGSLPPIGTVDCPAPGDLLPAGAQDAGGRRLPDLTLRCLGSERTVALRALGGRPVVLNLWASWCHPCRKEMPALERLHQELGDKVLFLGVNTRDVERPARTTIQSTGISYASVVDPDERLRLALRAIGLPDTVLVDATGRIRDVRLGELDEAELRDAIRTALGVAA